MPPEERDPAYLYDMLEAAQKVQKYVQGKTYQDYSTDDLLRDAVEREIEIVGEAAHRVSEKLKQTHPEIPWRKIIAQRNVLIHQYEAINSDEIWEVATYHIPRLVESLKLLIPPVPSDPEGE